VRSALGCRNLQIVFTVVLPLLKLLTQPKLHLQLLALVPAPSPVLEELGLRRGDIFLEQLQGTASRRQQLHVAPGFFPDSL